MKKGKGKNKREIKIVFSNRWLYTLITLGIIVIISAGVYAWTNSAGVGHEYTEIKPCANGQILKIVNGAWGCADATGGGITTETDPQVGILTNGKWCTSDGSAVNCNSNAPTVLAGVRIYKVTNSYCTTSGLTDSAKCWTKWCGSKANDCSGNCNQARQVQCDNQPLGYLIA